MTRCPGCFPNTVYPSRVLGLSLSEYMLLYSGMFSSMALCTCFGKSGITTGDFGFVAEGWKVWKLELKHYL